MSAVKYKYAQFLYVAGFNQKWWVTCGEIYRFFTNPCWSASYWRRRKWPWYLSTGRSSSCATSNCSSNWIKLMNCCQIIWTEGKSWLLLLTHPRVPSQSSESQKEDVRWSDASEDDRWHPDQSAASHAALHQVSPTYRLLTHRWPLIIIFL